MDHDPPKSPSKRTAGGHGRFGTIFASVQATVSAVATSFSPSQNRKSNSADASDPTDAADAANATNAADAANATDAADAADAIPQFSCDWASESCTLKNLKPSLCQYDGCDAPVHHLCQNLWQDSHGFVEESCSWYCRRHNKFYNQSMLGNANGDAVDFTGGDGLQLLSDNELESGMPPLPDINNNHSNLLLTDLDDNDKRKMTIGKPSKKARAPPTLTTTARKGKKRQAKCVVGARVSMTRKLLKTHLDYDSDAFKSIEGLSDELILYGTVVGSRLRGSFIVEFDRLPKNEQSVTVPRSHLITVDKNAEEPEFGHLKSMEATTEINDGVEEEMEMQSDDDINGNAGGSPKKTRKKHPWIASQESFLSLSDETKAAAKTFEHCYGDKPDEKIVWTILGDDEQITTDAMQHPAPEIYSPLKISIPWSRFPKDLSYNDIFFKYFFPSLEGKAELMDEYLWDRR